MKVYDKDYMDLLNDPNVEAVVIALPLHLHSSVAIQAMRKGKHVITEKLMGHSVHECKEMGRVAKETNKILAVGHQRNYSILYDNAKWLIAHGLIGDIHSIRAQWNRDNSPKGDSWKQPLPGDAALADHLKRLEAHRNASKLSAAELDKFVAQIAQTKAQIADQKVDAAHYGYEELTLPNGYKRSPLEELIRWRLWNRTGAGLMAELGSHQLDAACILIGAMHEKPGEQAHAIPLSVTGIGGRSIFPLDRECEDHVYCMFEFAGKDYFKDPVTRTINDPNKKIVVTYSSINGNGFGDWGEVVMGLEGTLVLEREQDAMLFKNASNSTRIKVGKDKDGKAALDTAESGGHAAPVGKAALELGPISRGYTEELEHWAWCIKNSGNKTPAPPYLPRVTPTVALADAVIALTANAVIHDPKNPRVEFQKEWFEIDRDETPEGVKPDITRKEYKV